MRRQFKDTIMALAKEDENLVLLFGDVSVYLFNEYQRLYPDRFYNVGICENTIIAMAAGMAKMGFRPYVHSIAPFMTERSYEHIKLDVAYNRFPVNIVTCGATFDYAWDGATHHCYTDLEILRMLPGMRVFQPGSTAELDSFIRSTHFDDTPSYYRLSDHPHDIDVRGVPGKGEVIRNAGAETTVVTAGPLLGNVVEACKDLPVNIVYFGTIKPFDAAALEPFRAGHILVVHDAYGLYESVAAVPGLDLHSHRPGDAFCSCYGTLPEIRHSLKLDPEGIREAVKGVMNNA
ncbi:hypothetical protein [uncultured Pseudodesulfovibrio sp.]|uniref:transketolase family protein n=1 Tax=uncultured Pseudodesulfovibrio sp. TaxID=2035858 RepID=UPI0029C6EDAE|nr:hypothetical protein [uncultured Pseudodesulfovibrio sp.]